MTVQDSAIDAAVVGTTLLPVGQDVSVKLTASDVTTRKLEFTLE